MARRHAAMGGLLLAGWLAGPLLANEVAVDRTTLQIDDTLTITVTLDGTYAYNDVIRIPVQNLVVDGSPSVSSEFAWSNGTTTRRKVFRYSAHGLHAGAALIGPIVLESSDGQKQTLAPVAVQVMPDESGGSSDPLTILRSLIAGGRDPIFVVAEADRTSAFAGEEVVVTWTLYNAASVQQWGYGEMPHLDDFWTEDLSVRDEQPHQVDIGGIPVTRLIIRRVALFPLRSGSLSVPPVGVRASVLRRVESNDPFQPFEGTLVVVRRASPRLPIEVKQPPSAAFDAVGDLTLSCTSPRQTNGGPVVFDVTVKGRGNLRAIAAPRWQIAPDATYQTQPAPLSVDRGRDDVTMTRRWRYLLFPSRRGRLAVPGLELKVLTSEGVVRTLACTGSSIDVTSAPAVTPAPVPGVAPRLDVRADVSRWGWPVAIGVLAIAAVLLLLKRRAATSTRKGRARQMAAVEPAIIREQLSQLLSRRRITASVLMREASERGDAYRAVLSQLDSVERRRVEQNDDELAARIAELMRTIVE